MTDDRLKRRTILAPFSYGGLIVGLVFFGFSLTPTLLPRPWLWQGPVSGVSFAIGYGLGALVWLFVGLAVKWRPRQKGRRIAWLVLAVAGIVFVVPALYVSGVWQNGSRELVGLAAISPWQAALSLPLAVVLWLFLLLIARLLRAAGHAIGRLLARKLPRPLALVLGAMLVAIPLLVLFGLFLRFSKNLADSIYSSTNATTAPGITQPTSPLRSGGPGSLVSWESLGFRGRTFIGTGPDARALEQFSGKPAKQPIRVYVGLDSAPTAEARADLALQELERTKAFDRSLLVVMSPTGTGWLEPQSTDSVEYVWNGDTALATIQYSYLPSWISFLVDKQRATDAGKALFAAVYAHWSQLPVGHRPRLLAYGLSLGSYAQQAAFSSAADLHARTGGSVFVGTPNDTTLWRHIEANRDAGSPEWQPVFEQGKTVRFAADAGQWDKPPTPWEDPHALYLQHASDPIVWWTWSILWDRPDWLAEPRGQDVSTRSVWFPFVSFVQVTVDQFRGTSPPNGHGHNYGDMMVSAWAAVARPPGWTDQDTVRLQQQIDGYPIE